MTQTQTIDTKSIEVLEECSRRSAGESITFPEVVQKLITVGVEFYYADLYQHTKTYYFPSGEAYTTQSPELPNHPVSDRFSAEGVSAAVKMIQRGEIQYREFLRLIRAAGTASYAVYIAGKRAIYTGRQGDSYTEWFPGARP
ncbi:MAG TPA: hypothetical protein VME86_16370 [Acidobacteriaceae bacterium]|nr:hypothetical protein [Acidobacteriaceae bacterium]